MKFNKQMISLVAIVISSVVAIWAGFSDYKAKLADKQSALDNEKTRNDEYKKVIENTTAIIDSNKRIISTQRKVIDQTEEIKQLQAVINNKNLKIIYLQGETLNNVTGGKSYPKLEFEVSGTYAHCFVINDTDFPIRNLNIEIFQSIEGHTFPDGHNSYRFDYDLKDIPSHNRQLFFANNYEFFYSKVTFFIKVNWLTGYYKGDIGAISNKTNSENVTVNASVNYPKKFEFNNLMTVNGKNAKEFPYGLPDFPRPRGMKTQDEIEHP